MKLKKIASLALAGLMAVSMLAGCGDNSSNNGNVVVNPSNSSIVSALNDGQSANNKVKITFTKSDALENALRAYVAQNGDDAVGQIDVEEFAAACGYDTNADYFITDSADFWDKDNEPAADGSQMYFMAATVNAKNESAALKMVAEAVDDEISELIATTKDDDQLVETEYYNFSYKGTVAMISAQDSDSVTHWYVALTITQNAEAKQMKKD